MANTVTGTGAFQITLVPQTTSDVSFTFNAWTYKAYLLCDSGATVNLYFAASSSGKAGITVPTTPNPPLVLDDTSIAGMTVTLNGTNLKNVQILEFFNRVS